MDPALTGPFHVLIRSVLPSRGLAGRLAPGAMAARAEGSFHRGRQANEDERACAHIPGAQDGLADRLVLGRSLRVSRGEGARRPFPMDDDLVSGALDDVLLHFPDVVAHIVDDVHAERFWRLAEDLRKCVPYPVRDHLAVVPGEVCAAAPGPPIVEPLLAAAPHA